MFTEVCEYCEWRKLEQRHASLLPSFSPPIKLGMVITLRRKIAPSSSIKIERWLAVEAKLQYQESSLLLYFFSPFFLFLFLIGKIAQRVYSRTGASRKNVGKLRFSRELVSSRLCHVEIVILFYFFKWIEATHGGNSLLTYVFFSSNRSIQFRFDRFRIWNCKEEWMGATINRKTLFVDSVSKIEIPRVPFARPSSPPLPLALKRSAPCSRGNRFAASQKNGRNCILFLFGRKRRRLSGKFSPQFVDAEINFEPV